MIKFLKALKNAVSPDYWANRIGERTGLYDKAQAYGEREKPWHIKLLLAGIILVLIFLLGHYQNSLSRIPDLGRTFEATKIVRFP